MCSQLSSQVPGTRFATGSLTMLVTSTVPRKAPTGNRATLIFDEPTTGGHYRDMHDGPTAWDNSHDDEERPHD